MPELPEVETVRRGLEPVLIGNRITLAEVHRPDLRFPFPDRFAERLTGRTVRTLRRRSKYILADLDGDEVLLVHLGMSGRMLIHRDEDLAAPGIFHYAPATSEKHDHVVLHVQGGYRVVFNDPRRFGAMDLFQSSVEASHKLLGHLGPEPLGNQFSPDYLQRAFEGKKTPVKSALLDQRIVAGLGNIYVCEALWQSGISPRRQAGSISAKRISSLVHEIRNVLDRALAAGGSSLRDYRQTDGELGYFQHEFAVYDREDAPCQREGCDGSIARIVQSGRSSFYCPSCQR